VSDDTWDFEMRHLANKRRMHDDGECAGIDCPYCDHERATGTGRYRAKVAAPPPPRDEASSRSASRGVAAAFKFADDSRRDAGKD